MYLFNFFFDITGLAINTQLPDIYTNTHGMSKKKAINQLHALEMHGEGIGSFFKGVVKRIDNVFNNTYSPLVEKLLKNYGDWRVVGFKIHRTPVQSVFTGILKVISLGKFGGYKDEYDKLFHLYCIFEITKGNETKYFLTEKSPNILVEMRSGLESKASKAEDTMTGTVAYPATVADMYMNYMKMYPTNWWKYHPRSNNCQIYIRGLINGLGITTFDDFIFQPLEKYLQGHTKDLALGVTDLGSFFGRLTGKGIETYECPLCNN